MSYSVLFNKLAKTSEGHEALIDDDDNNKDHLPFMFKTQPIITKKLENKTLMKI
jgi:hypothetical protein